MLLIEDLSLKYPFISWVLIIVLPFIISWLVYCFIFGIKRLSVKSNKLLKLGIASSVTWLLLWAYSDEILGFTFGLGGLSLLAIGGVILLGLSALGLIIWAGAFYAAVTDDMPMWGHLIIGILAPPMIIVMIAAFFLVMRQKVDK